MKKFDINKVRNDFPALQRSGLHYLDNAASTLKPAVVIDAVNQYYSSNGANVHRGVHDLSEEATAGYEAARSTVRNFLNARNEREIIFTPGTTAAINTIALSLGQEYFQSGDEIIVTEMEHHANIVPWQMLRDRIGCKLLVAPITDRGELDLAAFQKLLSETTKLVGITAASNALGSITPLPELIDIIRAKTPALVLVDAAQILSSHRIDVQKIDCDFLTLSGHKLFGPSGIGVLYGKEQLLNAMPPVYGGGDMILSVTFEKTIYNGLPAKFEAGTPNVAGAIGLGASINYIQELGLEAINAHQQQLLSYATEQLQNIDELTMVGTATNKVAIASFVVKNAHPHDMATLLNDDGVAIRAGHHCAQPVMKHFGLPATNRASFSIYNTRDDVDALVSSVRAAKELLT